MATNLTELGIDGLAFHHPLYSRVLIDKSEKKTGRRETQQTSVEMFLNSNVLEGYCSFCKVNRSFSSLYKSLCDQRVGTNEDGMPIQRYQLRSGNLTWELRCTHCSESMIIFLFADDDSIQKVGQFPSIVDVAKGASNLLQRELTNPYDEEYGKSITSAAHGFNIAAYVYMRRVLEFLIEKEGKSAISSGDIADTTWNNAKISKDKVELIESRLPEFFRSNHGALYKLLSIGIHQLNEDDAGSFYTIIREAVELILEDEVVKRRAAQRKEKSRNSLGQAMSALSRLNPRTDDITESAL